MVTKNTKGNYKFEGEGLSSKEKLWAGKRFREYQRNYHIESFSDIQLLEELVYRETIQERYKGKTAQLTGNKKVEEENIVPKIILESLNNNLQQILTLKEKLGLFEEKKEDEYNAFQTLEKKFEVWEQNHIEERKVTCPFCSEIFFLHIRTDKYKESGLKLFKNKVLCNEHLWKCYKEGKFTKEDFAQFLNVSVQQIDWLEKKIYNKPSK